MNPSFRMSIVLVAAMAGLAAPVVRAADTDCPAGSTPQTTFIQFSSPNIDPKAPQPAAPLTIKGKLSLPNGNPANAPCVPIGGRKVPAVLILHGSSGVDARGDFYQPALNQAGIATLQIDMWEARGVSGPANRPSLPILTYPDAFSALAFLSAQPGIDDKRIGVLGFSWGGVVSLASAEKSYASQFGAGRTFKAHAAHYPVCYAYNNVQLAQALHSTPAGLGLQFLNLTGAPVLIQVGSKDSYDNGVAHCIDLANAVNPSNGDAVTVNGYLGAFHAWDRLMVAVTGQDPFADEGSVFVTGKVPTIQLVPDVAQAYLSRDRVVRFFKSQL